MPVSWFRSAFDSMTCGTVGNILKVCLVELHVEVCIDFPACESLLMQFVMLPVAPILPAYLTLTNHMCFVRLMFVYFFSEKENVPKHLFLISGCWIYCSPSAIFLVTACTNDAFFFFSYLAYFITLPRVYFHCS